MEVDPAFDRDRNFGQHVHYTACLLVRIRPKSSLIIFLTSVPMMYEQIMEYLVQATDFRRGQRMNTKHTGCEKHAAGDCRLGRFCTILTRLANQADTRCEHFGLDALRNLCRQLAVQCPIDTTFVWLKSADLFIFRLAVPTMSLDYRKNLPDSYQPGRYPVLVAPEPLPAGN